MSVRSQSFDYDLDLVLPFVQNLIPGLARTDGMRCIGLRKQGELVAAAIYEGFNGQNIWVHLAGLPGCRWMTRDFLKAGFRYPNLVCNVQRLSGYVNESNTDARRLNEHLGYQEEVRLVGAAPDGGDVILYVMWRENCRFLEN